MLLMAWNHVQNDLLDSILNAKLIENPEKRYLTQTRVWIINDQIDDISPIYSTNRVDKVTSWAANFFMWGEMSWKSPTYYILVYYIELLSYLYIVLIILCFSINLASDFSLVFVLLVFCHFCVQSFSFIL
jgi:hypothetical protein